MGLSSFGSRGCSFNLGGFFLEGEKTYRQDQNAGYLSWSSRSLSCSFRPHCGSVSAGPLVPAPVSDQAKSIYYLDTFVFICAVIVFVLVEGASLYMIVRYLRRDESPASVGAGRWPHRDRLDASHAGDRVGTVRPFHAMLTPDDMTYATAFVTMAALWYRYEERRTARLEGAQEARETRKGAAVSQAYHRSGV